MWTFISKRWNLDLAILMMVDSSSHFCAVCEHHALNVPWVALNTVKMITVQFCHRMLLAGHKLDKGYYPTLHESEAFETAVDQRAGAYCQQGPLVGQILFEEDYRLKLTHDIKAHS